MAERWDSLDILVNNAGANWGAPLAEQDTKSWHRVLDVNVEGVFHTTKFLLPLLQAAGTAEEPARIINIGSVDGIQVPASRPTPTRRRRPRCTSSRGTSPSTSRRRSR